MIGLNNLSANQINSFIMNMINLRKFSTRPNIIFYINNLFFSKFVFFMKPSFFNAVMYVVKLCSKEKVERINAGRSITFVKNQHTFWNSTFIKNPRYSVRSHGREKPTLKMAIPMCFTTSCPQPTARHWLCNNMTFKSFLYVFLILSRMIFRHLNPPIQGSVFRPLGKLQLLSWPFLHSITKHIKIQTEKYKEVKE